MVLTVCVCVRAQDVLIPGARVKLRGKRRKAGPKSQFKSKDKVSARTVARCMTMTAAGCSPRGCRGWCTPVPWPGTFLSRHLKACVSLCPQKERADTVFAARDVEPLSVPDRPTDAGGGEVGDPARRQLLTTAFTMAPTSYRNMSMAVSATHAALAALRLTARVLPSTQPLCPPSSRSCGHVLPKAMCTLACVMALRADPGRQVRGRGLRADLRDPQPQHLRECRQVPGMHTGV